MSRVENNANKPELRRKKIKYRIIILSLMIVITMMAIYAVDFRINSMLGNVSGNLIPNYLNIFNLK